MRVRGVRGRGHALLPTGPACVEVFVGFHGGFSTGGSGALVASGRSVASGMHPEATQCFSAPAPTCSQARSPSGPEDDTSPR
jgi:hypothetical protein